MLQDRSPCQQQVQAWQYWQDLYCRRQGYEHNTCKTHAGQHQLSLAQHGRSPPLADARKVLPQLPQVEAQAVLSPAVHHAPIPCLAILHSRAGLVKSSNGVKVMNRPAIWHSSLSSNVHIPLHSKQAPTQANSQGDVNESAQILAEAMLAQLVHDVHLPPWPSCKAKQAPVKVQQ